MPPRSTTSLPSSPAWAAAGRPRCATCSAPSRPTRTPSSARGLAVLSSSMAARAPARPWSPCTAPPISSTPTLASVTAVAGCCSSDRTSLIWRTSPTCCPASARRASRPAPCATSFPRAPQPSPRPTREVARLKASADMVRAIEPAVRFYETPPSEGHGGRDAVRRLLGQSRRLGRRLRRAERRVRRTTRRATRCGRSCSRSWRASTSRTTWTRTARGLRRTWSASRSPRTEQLARDVQPRRGRSSKQPTSSATSGRCPPICGCAPRGSVPRRSEGCNARTPAPGPSQTCRSWTPRGNGSAIPRRHAASVVMKRPSPPSVSGWTGSSTRSCRPTTTKA